MAAPTSTIAAICQQVGISSIICPLFCVCLFVVLAQGTGKTNNGKMPTSAYLLWFCVVCYILSTLNSIYKYFTQTPCPTTTTTPATPAS